MVYDTSPWNGSGPNYYGSSVGYVNPYTPAAANPVEDSYFDVLLKNTQNEFDLQRKQANQQHDTLVNHLKQSRELFNEDLGKTYAQKLQKVNESAYTRGVGNSGIKNEGINNETSDKNFQVKSQDLLDTQKREIADQDLQQKLDSISASEAKSRASYKSPYANYSY